MGDIVSIAAEPEPSVLSLEEKEAIRVRSRAAGRKIADALVAGMNGIVDAKAAGQATEIASLKARIEKLESVNERLARLLAPREVESGGEDE